MVSALLSGATPDWLPTESECIASELTDSGRDPTRVEELDHNSLEVELGRETAPLDGSEVTEAGLVLSHIRGDEEVFIMSLLTELGREILAAGETHSTARSVSYGDSVELELLENCLKPAMINLFLTENYNTLITTHKHWGNVNHFNKMPKQ